MVTIIFDRRMEEEAQGFRRNVAMNLKRTHLEPLISLLTPIIGTRAKE